MASGKKSTTDPAPQREGLPSAESIVETREFVSPKGRKYTILKTTETDETDKPKPARRRAEG